MYKTSYHRVVHREKYEHSDEFEDQGEAGPEASFYTSSTVPGLESLQELNSRFARYINRARVLEQRNAVFRKQLETLQHMEEAAGLEEVFSEQISANRERIRELQVERVKLERELKDAERMMEDFSDRYRNECEYQDKLRGTLDQLNKEADAALLRNLEYQIESQFLQDDINTTKERHKKNLAEIQTYLNILHQINQTVVLMPSVSVGISEEQEKLLSQKRVPVLSTQLEECKSALCQLHTQKHKLQTETSALEQTIKFTQESFDEEIQLYNMQIESLRKGIEEAECLLEKYTNECRQLAVYQSSLENELDRYKRIIENEDSRLNSAIIGSPITLFSGNYRSRTLSPTTARREKDFTQAFQDIASAKPRQKNQAKKVIKKRELTSKDMTDNMQEEQEQEVIGPVEVLGEVKQATRIVRTDVPDGAQISKAFDTLCNIVRNRMRRYRQPEPITNFYTKGRYVLVTGESSYLDPCFYSTTPSAGHIYVTICDYGMPPFEPHQPKSPSFPSPPSPSPVAPSPPPSPPPVAPSPPPSPSPVAPSPPPSPSPVAPSPPPSPSPVAPSPPPSPSPVDPSPPPCPAPVAPSPPPVPSDSFPVIPPSPPDDNNTKKGDGEQNNDDAGYGPTPQFGKKNGKKHKSGQRGPPPMTSSSSRSPDSISYEKVEMVESVEKLSPDRRVKGYEETSMVVETMIEKTSRKKHGDRAT